MSSKIILLAEDDPDDAVIFKRAFRRATLPHVVHHVEDGQQAIDWLEGKGEYGNREKFPLPTQLVLDLKMPLKDGFDVLKWVREQKDFQNLPVIILSSSDQEIDVKKAYALGVTTYFAKTPELQNIMQYLRIS